MQREIYKMKYKKDSAGRLGYPRHYGTDWHSPGCRCGSCFHVRHKPAATNRIETVL